MLPPLLVLTAINKKMLVCTGKDTKEKLIILFVSRRRKSKVFDKEEDTNAPDEIQWIPAVKYRTLIYFNFRDSKSKLSVLIRRYFEFS